MIKKNVPLLFFLFTLCIIDSNVSIAQNANSENNNYRPLYHFTTDSNWINDPNGLVYFNGQYHLFSQYNPYGDKWGHMSWSHAVSTDLFKWKQLPLAIPEQELPGNIVKMVFSGSAVIDSFNTTGFAGDNDAVPMVAVYTAHVIKDGKDMSQYQSLAYSLDDGLTWQQYKSNPVLDIKLKDFRDPKVFWYQPAKTWIMVVAKPLEYKVQFYKSPDLIKWKFLSEFGNIGDTQKIWECPDIYQLPVEGSNNKKWVLSLSSGHPQKKYLGMQYFVGNFDGTKFTADSLDYPLYVDYGKDYYAGITYNNISSRDGRIIMIGWADCWLYAADAPAHGFRGVYAIPRTLTLRKNDNGIRLIQHPVKELSKHEQLVFEKDSFELNNSVLPAAVTGTAMDISFTIKTIEGAQAGVNLFKSAAEQTSVFYNGESQTLYLDRTRSGDTSFNAAFPSVEKLHVAAMVTGEITVRILIDKSIVEVFVNDGEYALTDRVFPKYNEGGIEFFSNNGKALFSNITIRRVNKTLH